MLQFQLGAPDLGGRWRTTADGFAGPTGCIAPYRHPALEDVAVASEDGRLLVVVRERCAGEPRPERAAGIHPGAPLTHVSVEQWERLHAARHAWPLQWTSLTLHGGSEPHATVEAGAWGTAPVYTIADHGTLHGSWDPARLFPLLEPGCLDPALAVRWLADFDTPYAARTLLRGLMLVTERATLRWHVGPDGQGRVLLTRPPAVERPLPGDLKPQADPVGAFWEILTASLARWARCDDGLIGCELSGGLDSAIVSAAAAALSPAPLRSYGIELTGPCAADQLIRRAALAGRFGLADTTVDIARFPPLDGDGCRAPGQPVVPWEECYYEAADALLEAAAACGTRTLLTGFGGDELCWVRPEERQAVGATFAVPAPPAFLTEAALAHRRAPVERAPRGAAADSTIETAAFGAAMYMRRGIWPVHPLATPALASFCARLPLAWRADRAVERRLLERLGCSSRVVRPRQEDDFSGALADALRDGQRATVGALFADSRLAELGLVDRDRLARDYAEWCDGTGEEGADPFYAAAVLELTLAAVG
jgi:asparagine synthase (glutamine-hydrolysing)